MTDARIRTRIDRLESVVPRLSERQEIAHKPIGIWYSVDHGWEKWCEVEKARIEGGLRHIVELGKENIVFIRNATQLSAFDSRYNVAPDHWRNNIDWRLVSREYDGIEIAPYLWEWRLDIPAGWYQGWDCASGCIWRPKGVRVTQQRKQENPDKVVDAGVR